jgi:two-component system, OmpR family, sensor kinase
MMRPRWLPDSLAARMMAVMVAGLTLSHLAGLGAYWGDLLTQSDAAIEQRAADRIAAAYAAVLAAPEEERERLAHLLSGPTLEAHWSRTPLVNAPDAPGPALTALRARLLEPAPDLRDRSLRIAYAEEDGDAHKAGGHGAGEHGAERPHMILLSAQAPDGGWLNLRYSLLAPAPHTPQGLVASTAFMALAVFALSVVLVRSATGPLRAMASAAERLGVDMTAAPLPETGPVEVRRAAHAFNEMQKRIQRLVSDRTQMLAAISHDLRTPLTVLRLQAEFVEDEEQQGKMLATIGEMETMVGSTLAFLREDAAHSRPEMVDAAALLRTICDMLSDAGYDVTFEGMAHAPLLCRSVALKRAFRNLIENAVKYGKRAQVRLEPCGPALRVMICDDGPGVPEADMEKVFQPFYRGDAARGGETGGFGLGLTIARSTVRAHGGDVRLENRAEGGLRAVVELPTTGDQNLATSGVLQ